MRSTDLHESRGSIEILEAKMPPTCAHGNLIISAPPEPPSGMITDRDFSLDDLISWLIRSGAEINGVVVRNVEGTPFHTSY
jgi:hypothetical protein